MEGRGSCTAGVASLHQTVKQRGTDPPSLPTRSSNRFILKEYFSYFYLTIHGIFLLS